MTRRSTPKPAARTTTRSLEGRVRLIDRRLRRVLRAEAGAPGVLNRAMRYCVFSGGKRFRPLLCLGACEAVGAPAAQALSAACALELIHTYSLVHDDLPAMDNADERRGRASCHRKFGEGTAILVGDALLTRAFELFGANGMPNALPILQVIGRASGATGLIGGQVLDLEQPTVRRQLEDTAKRKTAALITAGVVAGALAGRASASAIARLERFGRRLGLAFQLKDDLHDGDGMVKALGAPAVRAQAAHLLEQARRDLAPFGDRAWVLAELTEWLDNS